MAIQLSGSLAITGSLVATGQIVAQTLNVQQVTSSIVYSSGSNIFGNSVSNTQQFTGSLQVSGSNSYILGNVGINTNNPLIALNVVGNIRAGYANSIGINIGLTPGGIPNNDANAYILWGDNATFGGNNGDLLYIPRSSTTGEHRFYTANTGLASEKMRLTYDGKLGIGTTSPAGSLEVVGSGSVISRFNSTAANGGVISFQRSGTAILDIGTGLGLLGVGTNNDSAIYSTATMYLGANGTQFVTLRNGNVGIGASATPVYMLEVSSTGGSQRIRVGTLQNNDNTSRFEAITSNGVSVANSAWLRVNDAGGFTLGQSDYAKAGGDSGNFANLSSEVEIPRITVSSAGNVGIGTTSPQVTLDVRGSTQNTYAATIGTGLSIGNWSGLHFGYAEAGNNFYRKSVLAFERTGNAAEGKIHLLLNNAADTSNASLSDSRMTILGNGNMGIGTTSPGYRLDVSSGASGVVLNLEGTNAYNAETGILMSSSRAKISGFLNGSGGTPGSSLRFYTMPDGGSVTERMRINSDGTVLIGKTAPSFGDDGWELYANGTGLSAFAINNNEAFIFNNINTGTTYQVDFRTNSIERGNISVTDSGVTYNSTSDYRVKEDLKEVNGLQKVNAIKIYDFKFKETGVRMDGVLAHELQEVLPYAVTGEKDGKKLQGVDYSKIVPVLVKAIQELTARVAELESK